MLPKMPWYLYLIGALGLALLMIVHEGGHFLAARAYGMRVTKFSIGFGPTMVSFTCPAFRVGGVVFKLQPRQVGCRRMSRKGDGSTSGSFSDPDQENRPLSQSKNRPLNQK